MGAPEKHAGGEGHSTEARLSSASEPQQAERVAQHGMAQVG